MHGPKCSQQLNKITKKKKKKILVEHWLMHEEEGKTSTEISQCKGCENIPIKTDKCEKWIRRDHNTKVIPESLVQKSNNRINATLEQLLENRTLQNGEKKKVN